MIEVAKKDNERETDLLDLVIIYKAPVDRGTSHAQVTCRVII